MLSKKRLDDAIAQGKRNLEAIQLIHNWCANAKVVCDARGMLAEQSGLPIGSHHISCDFATDDSTLSCPEMADAAIDYHDRNCAGCAHRKAVRLPNITELLAARDRVREQQAAKSAKADALADAALLARDETRRLLKEGLSPVGQALVDDIAAFDRDRSDENARRLVESARLAPEHFSAELQAYILDVGETERWLDGPALEILETLGTDPARLAAVAAKALGGSHRSLAARVLLPIAEHLSPEATRLAAASAIDLAAPARRDVFDRGRASEPALLNRIYELNRDSVGDAIESLLDTKRTWQIELAARGVTALLDVHVDAADPHARTLISTYVRSSLLVTDFDELHGDLYAVRNAIVRAFEAKPTKIDTLLQEYLGATGTEYRKRVHGIYAWALRAGYDEDLPADTERARISFTRLLWATTGPFDEGVMQTAVEAFRGQSKKLLPIAAAELEAVLGACLLLADRSRELEKAPLDPNHPLPQIQRSNDLASYRNLMKSLIGLACEVVLADTSVLPRMGEFLDAIPEDRDQLRGIAVERCAKLADDATGLGVYLPHLYRAMVGPSTLERAGAAKAIGELGSRAKDNLPTLVFETFVPLLFDSFTAVHQSAARSLRTSFLPESLRMQALNGLVALIRVYRTETGQDNFLLHCVRTLAGSADEFGEASGAVRRWLIEVCMGIDPMFLQSEMRSLRYTLGTEPAFAKVVIRMLPYMVDRFNRSDYAQEMVRAVPPTAVLAHEPEFEEAGKQLAAADPWLALVVVDALARAGAPGAAERVARARIDAQEDSPRSRGGRLSGELVELAFKLEGAIARDDDNETAAIASRSNEIEVELKARRDEQGQRDSRSRFTFPT